MNGTTNTFVKGQRKYTGVVRKVIEYETSQGHFKRESERVPRGYVEPQRKSVVELVDPETST